MIHTVSAEGFDLTPKLQKYTAGKVKDIQKYIPRNARESAVLAIHFKENKKRQEKTCTLALQLPHSTLAAKETTTHMYAAFDIAIVEMRRQLADYKGKHSKYGLRHRFTRRLKRT
ncbi:ribosomal subunit interface protein [Candidatus Saccharibacteria bacterium]|nr:MAG: ribosomal subunit interface protein [Candidatus Saccharibacteria bacterium]PID99634.1 MAG: ribosomal subunit interface protein [Candidatus Saccharibacteria bacterium]